MKSGDASRMSPSRAWAFEAICDAFEREWQAGRKPRLEDYLNQVDEPQRPTLLRDLLVIELEQRGREGTHPTAEEYIQRLPQYADLIRTILHDAPTASQAAGATGITARPRHPRTLPEIPGYEILAELGRGGMGVVYKARETALKRTVALKVILAGEHADQAQIARFQIEAEAAARLQHPNIVQIHQIGEANGLPFFSLEYVDGGSLAEKLKGTPLPPRQAAMIVQTLAEAMHYAHEQGVVHRDLKPANVLLAKGAIEPKITDFGLAKRLDAASVHTRSGAIMGTPSYMAPEQAEGKTKEIGPAADVYALGAILYELLTGRPPFKAATPIDTVLQVISDEPVPPSQLQSKTPRDLETICLKCLRKEPAKRYGNALELAEDLRRFQAGEPILARPVCRLERGWRWCRRNPAVALLTGAVAATLLLGTAVSWFFALRAEANAATALVKEKLADEKTTLATANEKVAKEQTIRANANAVLFRKARDDEKERSQQLELALTDSTRNLSNSFILLANSASTKDLANDYLKQVPVDFRKWEWNFLKGKSQGGQLTLFKPNSSASWNTYGLANHNSCVSWSPAGERLASASSSDATVCIWDARTGKLLLELKGHTAPVRAVSWSGDGSRLASAAADKTVRIWDTRTGAGLAELKGHTNAVTAVSWSQDDSRLASASSDNTTSIWDVRKGQRLFDFKGHSVAWSGDGKRLATASADKKVRLWDARTGASLLTLAGQGACWSGDDSRLATAIDAKTIQIWDSHAGSALLQLRHAQAVRSLAWSGDGSRVATAAEDKSVRIWDALTAQVLFELKHAAGVTNLLWSGDGSRLATTSVKTVRLWDAYTGHLLEELDAPTWLTSLRWSDDDSRIAVGGGNTVCVFDATTNHRFLSLKGHAGYTTAVSWSPDGHFLASASADKTVRVWDSRSGRLLRELGHANLVHSVSWNSGPLLASASENRVHIWDARTGQSIRDLDHPAVLNDRFRCVAWSRDAKRIASSCFDDGRVWNAETGQLVMEFGGRESKPAGPIHSIAWSNDGSRLATGQGANVRVWNAYTGAMLLDIKAHRINAMSVAWSSDDKRLASASEDQTVRLWDADTGEALLELGGHTSLVSCVSWNADDSRLASGAWDKTVRVWDTRSGQSLLELGGHSDRVRSVCWSSDGNRLASASDSTVRVWDAQTAQTPLLELQLNRHTQPVASVCWSRDSGRLVSAAGTSVCISDVRTGETLLDLKGHTKPVSSVHWSLDGARIVGSSSGIPVERYVWDAMTGERLPNQPCPVAPSSRTSPDGQYIAVALGTRVFIVPTTLDPDEQLRRLWLTRPDCEWHTLKQQEFLQEGNAQAAAFHHGWALHARGVSAFEGCQFDQSWANFVAAATLRQPKRRPTETTFRSEEPISPSNLIPKVAAMPRLTLVNQTRGPSGTTYTLSIANAADFPPPVAVDILINNKRSYSYKEIQDLRSFSFVVPHDQPQPKEVRVLLIRRPSPNSTIGLNSNTIVIAPEGESKGISETVKSKSGNVQLGAGDPKQSKAELLVPTQTFVLVIPNRSSPGGLTFDGEAFWVSVQSITVPPRLQRYSADGKLLNEILWRHGGHIAGGMAYDGKHLYVLEYGQGTIFKLSKNGDLVDKTVLGQRVASGLTHTGRSLVYSLARNAFSNSTLYRLNSEMQPTGSAQVALHLRGLAWDGKHLWASTPGRILRFDEEAKLVAVYPTGVLLADLARADGCLWGVEHNGNKLFRFEIPQADSRSGQ